MTGDDLRDRCSIVVKDGKKWYMPVQLSHDEADALADLIDAARNVAADVDPAVTGNALRDALDALDQEAPA